MKRSEIPFGAQFSPRQIDLPKLLDIIHEKAGNRRQITEAIRQEFFITHATSQQWKLADNTVLALRAYQLLDEEAARPTQLADELLAASDDVALYGHFAKHILLNLRGLAFLETLTMMQISGEPITLHTLARQLEQRGLHVPRGSVHLSSMRLWLAKAGVFDVSMGGKSGSYEVNLDFKGWRLRSADTGGAEVDAIVEGARLIFSRWQIQAKNTGSVRLDDVAKEVGLSLTFIYSNVVLIITTGNFTKDAYGYVQHIHRTSNLNVILLNGAELQRISINPTAIVDILNHKAEQAMRVKERTDYFVAQ